LPKDASLLPEAEDLVLHAREVDLWGDGLVQAERLR
jgi:hypothetical protein